MERLSQCLEAWMKEEAITVAQLTERLGFQSKTSVFRLLHGQSNHRSCQQLCRLLMPGLSQAWQARFSQALQVEKMGLRRYALFQALNRCFFPETAGAPLPPEPGADAACPAGGAVMLLGDLGGSASRLIDALLARSEETTVEHWVTLPMLLTRPALLECMIAHATELRYRAWLLAAPEEDMPSLPWNLAFWMSPSLARVALAGTEPMVWHPIAPEAARAAQDALRGMEQVPLYRYDTLEAGSDYISFTEAAYQMEHNRRAVILKPTPGMQMLPADVVESTFRDFLSVHFDAVAASRETLIYTLEKRVKNFYQRRQSTALLLSAEAMGQFARTGVMPDQFYAFRPYTRDERVRILTVLAALAEKATVTLRFLPGPGFPYSFEAYERQGVLIYPSETCYNTRMAQYRELFLPGQEAFELFDAYAAEQCLQAAQPDTAAVFVRLIREAKG